MAHKEAPILAPPELEAEPGWSDIPFSEMVKELKSFVSGDPYGNRLRVRYYYRDSDRALAGKVWFGPGAQGPPGHAHGGSMAAVLDEAMGAAAMIAGHMVLAAKLTVRFRRMLPIGTVAYLEALVDEVRGKKIHILGRLYLPEGTVFAEAEGLFVKVMGKNPNDLLLEGWSQ